MSQLYSWDQAHESLSSLSSLMWKSTYSNAKSILLDVSKENVKMIKPDHSGLINYPKKNLNVNLFLWKKEWHRRFFNYNTSEPSHLSEKPQ